MARLAQLALVAFLGGAAASADIPEACIAGEEGEACEAEAMTTSLLQVKKDGTNDMQAKAQLESRKAALLLELSSIDEELSQDVALVEMNGEANDDSSREDCMVYLYDHGDFTGHMAVYRSHGSAGYVSYADMRGQTIQDAACSMIVKGNCDVKLCDDDKMGGHCGYFSATGSYMRFSSADLRAQQICDSAGSMNIMSHRQPPPTTPQVQCQVYLHDYGDYTGHKGVFQAGYISYEKMRAQRIQDAGCSLTIFGECDVKLCDYDQLVGHCGVFESSGRYTKFDKNALRAQQICDSAGSMDIYPHGDANNYNRRRNWQM